MYKTNFDGKHSYFAVEIQALLWTALNSVLRLHKAQYKNLHYGSERSQDSQVWHHATQNLEHGIFQTGGKKKKKELQNV